MSELSRAGFGRIAVGVDGSPAACIALRWAISEAAVTGDTVLAVIAWQYPISVGTFGWAPMPMDDGNDPESLAEKTLAEAVSDAVWPGCTSLIEQRVVAGNAPAVLVEVSQHAKLLVVGSRGHGTFVDALLGSVSQHCAHHANCPVVIVRGDPPH